MGGALLDRFADSVKRQKLGLYGVRVHQGGKPIAVRFWRSDDPVCLYSGSKTFTSLAVGICQDRGLLRITDRLLDYFPEYGAEASPGSESLTLRNLLQMASGKPDLEYDGTDVVHEDWARLFFRSPVSGIPGTKFFYNNSCTYMLSRVVEKVTGQRLRDFLVPVLFDPLGILNPQWHTCPKGHSLGSTGLYLHNEEYSRLGILMLGGGSYGGARVVSESYVRASVSDLIDSTQWTDPESLQGYGYQLWRCTYPGAFRADGLYGQFSIVFPAEDAVVTVTAHEERNSNDILRAVFKDILPQLK